MIVYPRHSGMVHYPVRSRQEEIERKISMNHDPQFSVVLDLDGTTAPIKVVSGSEDPYYEAIKNRCKKTSDFRRDFKRPDPPSPGVGETVKDAIASRCSCDKEKQKKFWHKRFPVCKILRKYKWKDDLPNDAISGLTVGIMQLPQGMAYALLAELPPVVGLYMAFFPVLIYFLLGSSKHISMGTVALCSLLTGSVISRFYDPALAPLVLGTSNDNTTLGTNQSTMPAVDEETMKIDLPNHVKIAIAASLCLMVGLVQLTMGVFNLGFITTYMSDPMIGGFTTGAAVHVGTSQVKYLFGLKIPRSDGVFQIIRTYVYIFKHIAQTNIPTLIMSVICIIILYTIKVHVNQRFKAKLKIPVPVELIVVVGGTMLSYFLKFSDKYYMTVVGDIPAGLPEPSLPTLPGISVYSIDAFIIAIVAFSQCVSLAALMAKKHNYTYDANQELIAYGVGNIFGSFFSCYPYAASVSRSSVQESAGGRTQVASIFSAVLVLIVILSIGPLFQSLPNCVLASIIVVALRSLILQILELPKIWKTSVYDCLIWVITFLSVVILHVDYGILIGILFSFFTVVIRTQRAKATSLQKIGAVNVYENSSDYVKSQSVSGVKIIGFNSPLYYANGDMFVKQVYQVVGISLEKRRKQLKRFGKIHPSVDKRLSTLPLVNETNELGSSLSLDTVEKNGISPQWVDTIVPPPPVVTDGNNVNYIIVDCSHMTFIDTVGAKIFKQLVEDCDSIYLTVMLAGINDDVWRVLEVTEFLKSYNNRVYLTVDDAVNAVTLDSQIKKVAEKQDHYHPSFPVRFMLHENENPDADENAALLVTESEF